MKNAKDAGASKTSPILIITAVAAVLIVCVSLFVFLPKREHKLEILVSGVSEEAMPVVEEAIRKTPEMPYKIQKGQSKKLPDISIVNYEFNGWTGENGLPVDRVEWHESNVNTEKVVANFTPKRYQVIYCDENENVMSIDYYSYGHGLKLLEVYPGPGNFIGWSDETGEVKTEISAKTSGDVRLHPAFKN